MLNIYVDGDGCAVKAEVYKVAERYKLKTFVVANKWMATPDGTNIEMVVVEGGFDAADDWIAEAIGEDDIFVTTDILLAARCVKKKARGLGPKGNEFTEDNIGDVVATRELMTNLRHMGEKNGPAPMDQKARSQFLGKLDQIIQSIRRKSV